MLFFLTLKLILFGAIRNEIRFTNSLKSFEVILGTDTNLFTVICCSTRGCFTTTIGSNEKDPEER